MCVYKYIYTYINLFSLIVMVIHDVLRTYAIDVSFRKDGYPRIERWGGGWAG